MITRYRLESSHGQIGSAVQRMGGTLILAEGAKWLGDEPRVIRVGDAAPILRLAAGVQDRLELDILNWGIPNRRRLRSALTFSLPGESADFALGARILIPMDAFGDYRGRSSGGRLECRRAKIGLAMAAGIEHRGCWAMLTCMAGADLVAFDSRQPVLTDSADARARWLLEGDAAVLAQAQQIPLTLRPLTP